MTPKVDTSRVDIRKLYDLHLEEFVGRPSSFDPEVFEGGLSNKQLSELFDDPTKKNDSDLTLSYDSTMDKLGELKVEGSESVEGTGRAAVLQLAIMVNGIRSADYNEDGFVDLEEVKKHKRKELLEAHIDERRWLTTVQQLVERRYNKIAARANMLSAKYAFQDTIAIMKLYNQGLLQADLFDASRSLHGCTLGKHVVNVVGIAPMSIHNTFSWIWGGSRFWMLGDDLAGRAAWNKLEERNEAIAQLEAVIDAGAKEGKEWALTGDLSEALKLLDEDTRELLDKELIATQIHKIFDNEDLLTRLELLLDAANNERATLGYGSGNSKMSSFSFWNLSGNRNNLLFARSVYNYLMSKVAVPAEIPGADAEQAKQILLRVTDIKAEAELAYQDMNGEGGKFSDIAVTGALNLFCLGRSCDPEMDNWSEEAKDNAIGRLVDNGLTFFTSYRGLGSAWDMMKLRGMAGTRKVVDVWVGAMRESTWYKPHTWNLFANGQWKKAVNEATFLELQNNRLSLPTKPRGRFGKAWDKTLGRIPKFFNQRRQDRYNKMSPEEQALENHRILNATDTWRKTPLKNVTKALLSGVIMHNLDDTHSPTFNSAKVKIPESGKGQLKDPQGNVLEGLMDVDREIRFERSVKFKPKQERPKFHVPK